MTNRDIVQIVIDVCKKEHGDCENCPFWVKKMYACIWYMHKIIGEDVMAYWDNDLEEKEL